MPVGGKHGMHDSLLFFEPSGGQEVVLNTRVYGYSTWGRGFPPPSELDCGEGEAALNIVVTC